MPSSLKQFLMLARCCFLTIVDRRQGWVRASKRRARSDAPYLLGNNFCFDEGPHLNPLPPGRGLALIMVRDGLIARAFIRLAMVLPEQWVAVG